MEKVISRHLLIDAAPPPGHGAREAVDGDPAGFGGANFDANMVIVLAALLCSLICALGLNSIVRCALRCSRRLTEEERQQESAARLGSATMGMKKSALRRMPVAVYGSDGVTIQETECPICLAEFADGEKVRVLPKCSHGFHMRCIDTWLISRSSCPTCRRSLLDCGAGTGAGAGIRADTLVIAVG